MRILIVEDEYLVAADMARHFEEMGAVILGPVPSIEQAEKHAGHADAAILDVRLNGELVFPFADELVRRDVPFVFFSAHGAEEIPARLRHVSALRKPADWDRLFETLFPSGLPQQDDVVSMLPKLRLAARLLLPDGNAADRLVERTLERAIRESARRSDRRTTTEWLSDIMEEIARSEGLDLMH
jgi:CheY-like chemotaxis protein